MEYCSKKELAKQVKQNFKSIVFMKGSEEKQFKNYFLLRLYLFFSCNYIAAVSTNDSNTLVQIKHKQGLAFVLSVVHILLFMMSIFTVGDLVVYASGYPSIIFTRVVEKLNEVFNETEKKPKMEVDYNASKLDGVLPSTIPFKEDGQIDYANAKTYFYGYSDTTVSSKNKEITLINLKENIVGIIYTVQCNGKDIYKSKKVLPPDGSDKVDIYSLLGGGAGVYNINIIQTYVDLLNTDKVFYSMQNEIKVRIE